LNQHELYTKKLHWRAFREQKLAGINLSKCQPNMKLERLIVGYTTTSHLLLDLDKHKTLPVTVRFIRMIQRSYPDVGDCLLVDSSPNLVLKHYHAVFDAFQSWQRITDITQTLACLGALNRDYMKIRKFRQDLTLRISSIDRALLGSEAPLPIGLVLSGEYAPEFAGWLASQTYGQLLIDQEYVFLGISEYLQDLSAYRDVAAIPLQIL
jgi:hypothetical protein